MFGAVGLVDEASIGIGCYLPAVIVGGIGVGEGGVVHRDGAVGDLLGIEIDYRLAGGGLR